MLCNCKLWLSKQRAATYWNYSIPLCLQIVSGELNLTFPVMFNPITWDAHAFPVFFGGTKLSEDHTIVSVPSIQMVYFVTADSKKQDAK